MTIKIERDAFLRVITRKGPLIEKAQQQQRDEEEFIVVTLPSKDDFFYNDLIPVSADDDDDQASLLSLSTDSSSTSSGTAEDDAQERRVTFAEDLVTDVFTRERTLPEEVPRLFYTSMETQTFRQQYRFERKVINELSIDPEAFPEEELHNFLSKATVTSPNSLAVSKNAPLSSPLSSSRHHISHVVVLHNDKLETFFHQGVEEEEEKHEDDLLASLVSPAVSPEPLSSTVPFAPTSSSSDDFFDSDSFWTGSLTWY
ncbi:hypothetical protein IV203_008133 [Nitzschia inconspicua]|uniref:Uncharacterized protein n=1 Tax=Nitzschia inconspicua TaxID=303405 RepID=A0A9K3KXZ4_9STRA|nr:hypothetical protein IV203_008133 [Nitzschia inconspicua]